MFCTAQLALAVDYETPPTLDVIHTLDSDTVNSAHYRFEPGVVNDGFSNTFVIVSEYQRIEARGNAMARERALEQVAIAALRQIKSSEAYSKGLEAAAEAPLALTRQTLEDPVAVLKNLPQGISNVLGDLGNALDGIGKSKQSDGDQMTMLGYSRAKRRFAAELNVDPFSSNQVLQTELDDVTWSIFAGGATIDIALSCGPVGAGLAIQAAGSTDRARYVDWSIPSATLIKGATDALQAMGLSQLEADDLMHHRVCTLTHQTQLVSALVDLSQVAGRDAFARLATQATDEHSCRVFSEVARLIRLFHRHHSPIVSIKGTSLPTLALSATGETVAPLPVDYLTWSPVTNQLIDSMPAMAGRLLWLSGTLSTDARNALALQGVVVHEQVFERLDDPMAIAKNLVPNRVATKNEGSEENQTGALVNDVSEGVTDIFKSLGGSLLGGSDTSSNEGEQ